MPPRNPFHEGEIAVQQRAGERAVAVRNGAMIGDQVVGGAQPFLAAQRLVAVATFDDAGRGWASLWLGRPGFVQSDDEGRAVRVGASRGVVSADDPVGGLLSPGRPVGLLAIELETRRRLRLNGVVGARDDEALDLVVAEAFPNCPKYIQRRHLTERPAASAAHAPSARGHELDAPRRAFIAQADTVFVASRHPVRGVDASHRGGEPGFVHVEGARTLRFPDYPGNGMFQTLGNLAVDPRAGVVLVDFVRGRLLSLTGTTATFHDAEPPGHPTGGTGRSWTLDVESWVEFSWPAAVAWELLDRSRFNPPPTAP